MNRGIYATATGMAAAEHWMDVVSNNLANIETVGFKRDGISFDDMMRRQMLGDGGSGALLGTLGSGAAAYEQYTDFATGTMRTTGNSFDLAMNGNGMFAIQTDAGVKYTRNGSFAIMSNGGNQVSLVTKEGFPVLDDRGRPITFNSGQVKIDRDGSIAVDEVDTGIKVGVYAGTFKKDSAGGGQFNAPDAQAATAGTFAVQQGMLESSNVNAIEAMVQMIAAQRSYELAQKSILQQDDDTGKLVGTLTGG